jgi:hypothetical protein
MVGVDDRQLILQSPSSLEWGALGRGLDRKCQRMQGHKQSERRISEWSGLNWRSGCISETDSSKPQTTTWEQSVVNWDAGSLKQDFCSTSCGGNG